MSAPAVAAARQETDVEIAWTGPMTTAVPVRATNPVLLEVIATARSHLILLSFAAYRVADVVDALHAAAGRGVDVRVILETADTGHLSVDAAQAFASLGAAISIWTWPSAKRPAIAGSLAAVHAEAAIADDAIAFVSSANLTDSGLTRNMELGVVIRGGHVPRRLAEHFRELMERGILCPAEPSGEHGHINLTLERETKNTVRFAEDEKGQPANHRVVPRGLPDSAAFDVETTPTPHQARALALLGITPRPRSQNGAAQTEFTSTRPAGRTSV